MAADERWPVLLVRCLREAGLHIDGPVIIAKTGWTTGELLARLHEAPPTGGFDLVSLLIGVNNQYRGQPLEGYRRELRELIRLSIRYAGRRADRVIVLSIPDWGATPFAAGRDRTAIAAAIDAFNRVLREEAARQGIRFIDVTPSSREMAADASLTASDGLHPSGRLYARWVRMVCPVALEILRPQGSASRGVDS